jgi:tRNA(Arg) A34 adenosine deaminase TadA
MIPLGQPILVGHHSEKRARRDADRIFDLTGQGIALHREAEQLARRARTTEARAEDAIAHAEIARNRESIETFIEQLRRAVEEGR